LTIVALSHTTHYRYGQPVAFGEHRILVRPRESFDQRLLDASLSIVPEPAELRWVQDVFGNAVAVARFGRRATELLIVGAFRLEHTPIAPEDICIELYARRYPFTYSSEDMPDLARSIERAGHDPDRVVDEWARGFLKAKRSPETLGVLVDMTSAIHRDFTYLARYEKGTQTPLETLRKKQGTCRDFAVLMIDAARALGLAARFVSGYLYDPTKAEARRGGGNTHAWVRIFLPGSGWIEFDPTNGIVGNRGLIRVAVSRDPFQAIPISGTWRGFPSDNLGMRVTVEVTCSAGGPAEPGDDAKMTPAEAGDTKKSV
jgi:transglutaminase-like putative cysteine protease